MQFQHVKSGGRGPAGGLAEITHHPLAVFRGHAATPFGMHLHEAGGETESLGKGEGVHEGFESGHIVIEVRGVEGSRQERPFGPCEPPGMVELDTGQRPSALNRGGQPGQFDVSLKTNGSAETFRAGAIVQATGWKPYDASRLGHLGYGQHADVVTNVQLEEMAQAIYREWFVHLRYPGHQDAIFVDAVAAITRQLFATRANLAPDKNNQAKWKYLDAGVE